MSEERTIEAESNDTRRDALKKIGVGAGIAWAAPTILTLNSPAAANSGTCPNCGSNLLTDGTGSPGWSLNAAATYSAGPPPKYQTGGFGNYLSMDQTTTGTLLCDGRYATLTFSIERDDTVGFTWGAYIVANPSSTTIASGGESTGTTGSKTVASAPTVIPSGTTSLYVFIEVNATDGSSSRVRVVSPSLIVSC